MNSYTYMHNHKVLNDKPNEMGVNNCNCRNKDNCPLQTVVKQNASFIKPTLTVTSLDTNKNATLAHVKQHLKIVSGIIKSRSTTLNIKMIRNYQKNFGKSKSAMELQKLHAKIIRICPSYNPNSKRCLLCLNEKYEIATYKGNNLLNKRTEIINTCRQRNKYKLVNCETID